MNRLKIIGLALVAVFAFSAIAAAAAPAVEGPFYKVGGKELSAAGKTLLSPVAEETAAKEKFVLKASAGPVVTCNGVKVLGRIWNLFPLRGNFLGVIHFLSCSVAENGTKCPKVKGGTILTQTVLGTLGYGRTGRAGPILVLFQPDTGKVFSTFEFEPEVGGTCTFPSATVEGTAIGEAFLKNERIEVGSHEAEQTVGELHFTTPGKTIFIENPGGGTGTLTETKAKLTAFGLTSTFSGQQQLDLEGGEAWGIFTS